MIRNTVAVLTVIGIAWGMIPSDVCAQTGLNDGTAFMLDCTAFGMHGTGFAFVEGDTVIVFARGLYRHAGYDFATSRNWVGPNGGGRAPSSNMPCQEAAALALIGKIGDGELFPIGAHYAFTADTSGELSIGINENSYVDNYGYLIVSIACRFQAPNSACAPPPGNGIIDLPSSLTCTPSVGREGSNYAIRYALKQAGPFTLEVCDVNGRRIVTLASGYAEVGQRETQWSGHDSAGCRVPAGTYFAVLSNGERRSNGKMIHIR